MSRWQRKTVQLIPISSSKVGKTTCYKVFYPKDWTTLNTQIKFLLLKILKTSYFYQFLAINKYVKILTNAQTWKISHFQNKQTEMVTHKCLPQSFPIKNNVYPTAQQTYFTMFTSLYSLKFMLKMLGIIFTSCKSHLLQMIIILLIIVHY